jgi:peroxiredoxin
MRKLIVFWLICVLFANVSAQDNPQEEKSPEDIPAGAIKIGPDTVIKDIQGNIISFTDFMAMMNKGGYVPQPVFDEKGGIKEIIVRKSDDPEMQQNDAMAASAPPLPEKFKEKIGTEAPALSVSDINGKSYNEEFFKGKVVVINFWFIACKPCVMEMPELNKVVEKFKKREDVVFIAPTFDPKEKVVKFLGSHEFKYNIVTDSKELVGRFGAFAFPTHVIIDKEGRFHSVFLGANPKIGHQIETAIQDALAGKGDVREAK